MINMSCVKLIMIIFLGYATNSTGQKVLQIEVKNHYETIKFFPGDYITFKTHSGSNEWETKRIVKIMVEEEVIVFDKNFHSLSDFKVIRLHRESFDHLTIQVMKFAVGLVVLGGIVKVTGLPFAPGVETFITAAGVFTVAWITNKLFRYQKIKLGKRSRLRVLDLSITKMTSPDQLLLLRP
jgi:hypothetical protein